MSAFDHDALLASLREGLARALKQVADDEWVAVGIPVPGDRARSLLDRNEEEESVYFSSGRGSSTDSEVEVCDQSATYVGVGSVASRRFEGAERFADAEAFIQETFSRGRIPKDLLPYVRFFGGAAFSPGRDGAGPCWSEFGDARFLLPRCLYVDQGSGLLICASYRGEMELSLRLAGDVLSQLSADTPVAVSELHALSRKESEAPSSWREMVEAIQGQIQGGAVEKVVAARRITLQLSHAPLTSQVLDRLNDQAALCARFALRVGAKTFVGATPERLIRRRGRRIETEALAGSMAVETEGAADLLRNSDKNRREHALVVEALRSSLGSLCATLTIPKEPEIRHLRRILHLRTPITGTLGDDHHVLRLVARLHPTPAVGGLPTAPAVAFIQSHERAERGWYAAPVGWVDSRGNGEFVVALRSGLIAKDKVHLYAGAGIVDGSDSDEEFEETELKLTAMLGALGLRDTSTGSQHGRPAP